MGFTKRKADYGHDASIGTAFINPVPITDEELKWGLVATHSQVPPPVPASTLESTIDRLLQLYPDDPTVGSPFGTGNETFGMPSSFKRQAAICKYSRLSK